MSKKTKNVFSRALGITHNFGIRYLITQARWYLSQRLLGHLQMILAYPKFKELSEVAVIKDQALDFVFSFKRHGFSVHPQQSLKEISMFLSLAEKEEPRVVLEIGTGSGGTLFLLTRVTPSNAILVSADLCYPKWRDTIIESFPMKGQTLQLSKGDSHNLDTFNSVRQYLDETKIDLLFIDGAHEYDAVKMDFELYSQLVREGGLVAFHDIADNFDPDTQVPEFWNEIKNGYKHIEIIEKKGTKGIGILFLNSRSGIEKV